MKFTLCALMCQVDNVLRNLKALFADGGPFAAEKGTETWQKYESILWKETVSEKYFSSLPEDQCTWNSLKHSKNEVQ